MKLLFLDWSGDAGFKINGGASKFLVHACVTSRVGFSQTLNSLRRQHNLGSNFHFHFNSASQIIKRSFFTAVGQTDMQGVILRFHKAQLSPAWREKRGDVFIAESIARTVMELPEANLDKHTLIIDGNRDEVTLHTAIRKAISHELLQGGKARLRKVSVRPAREEDGLQIADMLAGAAASERLSDNALLGRLGDKIKMIDFWGEK
jgi:hypothetical protein